MTLNTSLPHEMSHMLGELAPSIAYELLKDEEVSNLHIPRTTQSGVRD